MDLFRNCTIQLVGDEDTPVDDSSRAKTVFLRAAIPLELDVVIGDAAPDIDVSALGHLWADIEAHNGAYSFEIARLC